MRRPRVWRVIVVLIATVLLTGSTAVPGAAFSIDPRTLDGHDNNPRYAAWGQAGTQYL